MASQAQSRASTKYNQKLNSITIRVDKETGAKIREAAESRGMSLKEFLLMAVKPYIEEKQIKCLPLSGGAEEPSVAVE